MANLNKVMIIGRLGKDPEMRFTANGSPVVNFSVAVSRNYTGPDGERHEETEWFNVVAWEKLAETCNQFLGKGRTVYVEGRQKTRSWQGQDGQKHYRTEVVANSVEFLDRQTVPFAEEGAEAEAGDLSNPDDLPF